MNKTSTLIIKVTPEEHAIIKKAAVDRSTSMSKMVLQALLIYLEKFNIGE